MNKYRKTIQEKITKLSEKNRKRFLFWYSLSESFLLILPPPDLFLIYAVFTKVKSWLKYVKLMIFGSVIGGALSYFVGYFFFVWFGDWFLSFKTVADGFALASDMFSQNIFIAIFLAGLTPLPYTVFTITAGVFKANLFVFLLASILSRSIRFSMVGFISSVLGKKFANLFIKYFDLFAILILVLIGLYIYL
jgi:membrane protein YqaA with SNARE-associated domain